MFSPALSVFPYFLKINLSVLTNLGLAASEERECGPCFFPKISDPPRLEQGSKRGQEILYSSHVVEAGFLLKARRGRCLNLAFFWGTLVGTSEI